jgi:hypothetical protein
MKYDGKLFIDEADAYTEYGVFVEQYGYKELIQMPSFKKVDTTEWLEFDGVEADLISPVLDTRQLQIQFCITNIRDAEDFFDDLTTCAYHTFYFVELKKTYKLRMISNGSFSSFIKLGKLTLTFADDFPAVPSGEYYQFGKSEIRQSGYELDGLDLSQFGSYVLRGTDDSIRKAANVRDNLKISVNSVAGLSYDDESVYFKTKDVTLELLIDATDIDEFWARYNALFSILMQPEQRTFYFSVLSAEYDCYYKTSAVSKFEIIPNGRVWCEFSVVLVFTAYRPESSWMLLATEDFDWVITEDGLARIKVRPKYGISLLVTEDGKYIITESDSDKIYINNQK